MEKSGGKRGGGRGWRFASLREHGYAQCKQMYFFSNHHHDFQVSFCYGSLKDGRDGASWNKGLIEERINREME